MVASDSGVEDINLRQTFPFDVPALHPQDNFIGEVLVVDLLVLWVQTSLGEVRNQLLLDNRQLLLLQLLVHAVLHWVSFLLKILFHRYIEFKLTND